MNHGKCKNCWWYVDGVCYMQSTPPDYRHKVKEDSYCPDYHNRKKEKTNIKDCCKIYF